MKTVKLGACFVLVLALVVGFCLPVQAGVLDAQWYKARIQGETRLFVTNALGEVEKIKLKGDFYFKVCSGEEIELNACGGETYITALAVADLNDNGEFGDTLEEVFSFFDGDPNGDLGIWLFNSCGPTETSFFVQLGIGDVDLLGEIGVEVLALQAEGVGTVKREGERLRANSGNGGTAATVAEVDEIGALVDLTGGAFRKLSWKADAVAVEDLPESLIANLILLELIDDITDLDCFSEIVVEPEPPVEAGE
jgi:hypothetical protein